MNALLAARLAIALAGGAAPVATVDDPCAPDIQAFCANVKAGAGRVVACLEDHASKVSNACRAKLDADKQRSKAYITEFMTACRPDKDQFCQGVRPGGGRLVKCLSVHDYELSPQCQTQMTRIAAARAQVSALQAACRADAERLCPGTEGRAGELQACLQTNEAQLSPECRSVRPGAAMEAGSLVQTLEEFTSEARVEDTVQVLQGLNTVAFSRNQITLSYDYLQRVGNLPANLNLLGFNALLVFGSKNEFAVQLKVPVAALFPTEAGLPTVSGIADVNTAFAWAFYARGSVRQYLAVALQWNSASEPLVGAPWLFAPVYAIAVGLAGWVSLTTELVWYKSFGNLGDYSGVNLLQLRPIVAFNLPSQFFLAIDTKLGWDFIKHIFVPVMRFQAGKLIGNERNVTISAWYQLSLNTVGKQDSFDYGIGTSISYFFNW
jgi:hypothetical protein